MTRVDIEWDDSQMRAILSRITKDVEKEVHREVLKAALAVEFKAKHRAPKRYGFLRASLGHVDMSQVKGSPKSGAPAFNGIWREKNMDVTLGSDLVYAWIQENLWDVHQEGVSPFLEPSVNDVAPLFEKELEKLLERMLGGS